MATTLQEAHARTAQRRRSEDGPRGFVAAEPDRTVDSDPRLHDPRSSARSSGTRRARCDRRPRWSVVGVGDGCWSLAWRLARRRGLGRGGDDGGWRRSRDLAQPRARLRSLPHTGVHLLVISANAWTGPAAALRFRFWPSALVKFRLTRRPWHWTFRPAS